MQEKVIELRCPLGNERRDNMNSNELRGEIVRQGYSICDFASQIGIGKKAFYAKLSGKSSFKQSEIQRISKVLDLDGEKILAIFFNDRVS